MIPKTVRICGVTFIVAETDNTEKLGGDTAGFWDAVNSKIFIKKSALSQEKKSEAFLHEVGEVILRNILNVKKADFSENDWSTFIRLLYATIVDNNLTFGESNAEKVHYMCAKRRTSKDY